MKIVSRLPWNLADALPHSKYWFTAPCLSLSVLLLFSIGKKSHVVHNSNIKLTSHFKISLSYKRTLNVFPFYTAVSFSVALLKCKKRIRVVPQSNEFTRGPPGLIQYGTSFTGAVHIGARALIVLNLIWFGCIDRLSYLGGGGLFPRSNDFYLPSLSVEERGGVDTLWLVPVWQQSQGEVCLAPVEQYTTLPES